jgi:hypothetical protein
MYMKLSSEDLFTSLIPVLMGVGGQTPWWKGCVVTRTVWPRLCLVSCPIHGEPHPRR